MAVTTVSEPLRPHVMFVLLDDWGWADAGWHRLSGQDEGVKTPHMDTLVRNGLELNRHYTYKMCSPSRTAMQSGRNPIHVSVTNTKETYRNQEDTISGWSAMPVNMTGLGEIMARGGYKTHFYGKWDVGMATPFHTPLGRGYAKSLFYFHHTNDYWSSASIWNESDAGDTTCPGYRKGTAPIDLWEDDHPAFDKVNDQSCCQMQQIGCTYEDDLFADRVYAAISTHDNSRKSDPLFIFWAPHAIHDPLEVPQVWADQFASLGPPQGRWERQYYLAMLAQIDDKIGRAVQLLKSRRMWDDTFLVVCSDNGGPIYQHGKSGGNNWPLKGGKVSNWEGGIRVNAFVSGGFLPESVRGTQLNALVASWDWYSTLAGLAGVSPFDERAAVAGLPPVDSMDLWPVLSGANTTSPRTELAIGTDGSFIGIGKSFKAHVGGLIRGRYKLLVQSVIPMAGWTGPIFPNFTNWDADYALDVCGPFPFSGCLYDIVTDPEERVNLAKKMPQLWHEMNERRKVIEKTAFSPDRGSQDKSACTAVAERYNGFWGPWAMLDAWPEARGRGWQTSPQPLVV